MVSDAYQTLLEALTKVLQIEETLVPDENNSCLVRLKNGLEIQVEPDESGEYLVMGSALGLVQEGHFRESLFESALKHNALPYPRFGTFAYSAHTRNLILFKMVPMYNLLGPAIAQQIASLSEKAIKWKTAIDNGEVPLLTHLGPTSSAGMFNLHP